MKEITYNELKAVQLSILHEIDKYCKKNNLHYYLYAGSLIGAVRHKGYIPWDDDIDICMKRNEYDSFFSNFNESNNTAEGFSAICFENNKDYYLASGKVISNKTVLFENADTHFPMGVYVDVFPLDNIPNDDGGFLKLNKKLTIYRKALIIKNIANDRKRSWYKRMLIMSGKIILFIIPRKSILKRIVKLAKKYSNDDSCNRIADISVFTYGMKEVHLISEFDKPVELEFEGHYFWAPCGYDSILKRMYGDYMVLPPKEKQKSHHSYQAFWKE